MLRHCPLPAWLGGAVFLVPFAAYLWSMPPDVVFEDAGLLVSACHTRGVPHPPGYPLYTLLCWPFSHLGDLLPVSPAKGVAILSALLNALAAVALCWVLLQLLGDRALAALLAVTYAFGRESWSQAIIPEVYALNALLFFLAFALVVRHQQSGRFAHVAAAALVAGLALSNHWPLFVFAAPALALLMGRRPDLLRRLLSPRRLLACLALLALGLLPYAHLALAPEGAYVFGGPIDGVGGVLDHVSRRTYLDRIGRLEVEDRFLHALDGVPLLFEEHAPPVAAALLLGLWVAARSRERWLCAAVLWLPVSSLVLLKLVAGFFWVDDVERHAFAVYHQAAYGMSLLFAGCGLAWLFARFRVPALAAALAAGILPLATLAAHAGENQRSGDTLALRQAELFWRELPQGAVLDLRGDLTFPALYLRVTRGLRPDVRVVSLEELLGHPIRDGWFGPDDVRELAAGGRRIFLARALNGDFRERHHGLFSELLFDEGESEVRLSEEAAELFSELAGGYADERDTWNRAFAHRRIEKLSRLLQVMRHHSPHLLDDRLRQLFWEMQATSPGRIGSFLAQVIDGAGAMPDGAILEVSKRLRTEDPGVTAEQRARLLHIEGSIYAIRGLSGRAERMFEHSLWLNPSPHDNPSVIDLLLLHGVRGDWEDYARMRARYGSIGRAKALDRSDRECAEALGRACAPGG